MISPSWFVVQDAPNRCERSALVARQLMAGLAMSQIMHGRRSAPPDVGLSVSAIAGGTKMSGARDAARRSALDPHVA